MAVNLSVLWHVVLISFRLGVSEEQKREVFDRYQTIDKDCGGTEAGILYWKVAENLDLRKGVHIVEMAAFRDNNALQAFRVHPKHAELTSILREIADWVVGDMNAPFPERPPVSSPLYPPRFADESMQSN